MFNRKNPGESLFDILPPHINDTKANYALTCSCEDDNSAGDRDELCKFNLKLPSFLKANLTTFNLCDRKKKRDVQYSDDLTDNDYELFKKAHAPGFQGRLRRAVPNPVVPLENATRYCSEKIADAKVGRLCSKVGVDVSALVDSCALDISVSGLYIVRLMSGPEEKQSVLFPETNSRETSGLEGKQN